MSANATSKNTVKNTADRVTGRAKEITGVITGNRDLQYRGVAEQFLANLRQAGVKLKDAFKV